MYNDRHSVKVRSGKDCVNKGVIKGQDKHMLTTPTGPSLVVVAETDLPDSGTAACLKVYSDPSNLPAG